MCGIVGAYVNRMNISLMKNMFDLFLNQQRRGVNGAGISINSKDDLRRFRSVSPFRVFSVYNIELWDKIFDGDRILFHHRLPTSSANKPSFNHPIQNEEGDIHLIHNGVIVAHQYLFTKLVKKGHVFETFDKDSGTYTDSEVLLHLIEERLAEGDNMVKALKWLRKNVNGSYSCLISVKGDSRIYVIRKGRELNVSKDRVGNIYVSSQFRKMNDLRFVYELVDGEIGFIDNTGYKSIFVPKHEEKQQDLNYDWQPKSQTRTFSERVMLPADVVELIKLKREEIKAARPNIAHDRLCMQIYSAVDNYAPYLSLETYGVRKAIAEEIDKE